MKQMNAYYYIELLSRLLRKSDEETITHLQNTTDKGKYYAFKRSILMERVKEVLSLFKSVEWDISTMLDIGTGRGSLLFPLLDTLDNSNIDIQCWDIDPSVVKIMNRIHPNVSAFETSITGEVSPKTFDLVVASEILEHIESYTNLQTAVDNLNRLSNKYIIISVPNLLDDNEEHHRVITERDIEFLTRYHTYSSVKYKNIQGHLIAFFIK